MYALNFEFETVKFYRIPESCLCVCIIEILEISEWYACGINGVDENRVWVEYSQYAGKLRRVHVEISLSARKTKRFLLFSESAGARQSTRARVPREKGGRGEAGERYVGQRRGDAAARRLYSCSRCACVCGARYVCVYTYYVHMMMGIYLSLARRDDSSLRNDERV